MKIATTRVVFDRHHTATKTTAASVLIEVSYARVRNFYNTGIKVCKDQFRNGKVVNHGQMAEYQDRINAMRADIENYINDRVKAKEQFSLDNLKTYMQGKSGGGSDSFLRFMLKRIYERPVAESTRKGHMSVYHTLKSWGRIQTFSDLTEANIKLWDDLAHNNAIKAKSVWSYHKVLKIYIREAKLFGNIEHNPYDNVSVKRSKTLGHRFLTTEELQAIKELPLDNRPLINARLCFLFQCYTGLAYSDLCEFDFSQAREIDGKMRLRGARVKTGEPYNITLIGPAIEVLEQCRYHLPIQEQHVYNRNLQAIQFRAGITTHLTSHVGRHTFATSIAIKNHIPIEVLQKMMGHTDIKTTQIYAKVLQESVDAEFDRLDEIL